MGFNFSGVAISQKKKEDMVEIQEILGVKLTFSKEICFEEALSRRDKKNNEFDVYFSEKGVLIFTNDPYIGYNDKNKGVMVTRFGASETAMVFMISATLNGQKFREFMEHNLEKLDDEGQKFHGETDEDDGFCIVTKAISHTVGQNFWSIEPSEKAYRYVAG